MTRSKPTSRKPGRKQRSASIHTLRHVEQPAGQKETKREKFLRIAPRRLANALNAMEILKQLADPEFYDSTDEHRAAIIRELTAKVYDVRESFRSAGKIRHRNIFLDTDDNLEALGAETGVDPLAGLEDVL